MNVKSLLDLVIYVEEGKYVLISLNLLKSYANNEIKDGFGRDFPVWFRNMGNLFGKQVKMDDGNIYTLIGMSYTYLDYYYILKDVNNRKSMWSCVGKFQLA